MILASCLGSLGLLIEFTNCFDGELLSIWWSRFPLGEFAHCFFHLSFVSLFWACFSAAVLILSFLRKILGREERFEDCPLAAFFASSSTSSLPSIPMCPAVHRSVSSYLLLPLCLLICLAVRMKLFAM